MNSNKVTARRMKLFEDAEHYGAEIIRTPGWVCALCRTYDQIHCFGRGKPKADLGNPDTPDAEANLRDDEGITPEKKAFRDAEGGQRVKDGLGFDDQPFEAGWCVAGGDKMYFGSTLAWGPGLKPCASYAKGPYAKAFAEGEQCPYEIFLEMATGKLYISNLWYAGSSRWGMVRFGNTGWGILDYNCERNGYTEGGIAKRIMSDAAFAEICQKAAVASLRGLTGAPQPESIDVVAAAKEELSPRRSARQPQRVGGKKPTVSDFCKMIKDAWSADGHHANRATKMAVKAGQESWAVTGIKAGLASSVVLSCASKKKMMTIGELAQYLAERAKDGGQSFITSTAVEITTAKGETLAPASAYLSGNTLVVRAV